MFSKLSDEKILDLYYKGNDTALDFLINKYKYLASKIARSYFLVGAESEDILQEAMIGLYSACRNFKEGNIASFKTFASLCITRAVQTAVKRANRLKNKVLNQSYSLSSQGTVVSGNEDDEDICIYIPSNVIEPEDALLENELKIEIEEFIKNNLTIKEKKVLALYLQGLSYVEIATKLNQNTKSVGNAIGRSKKKLSKFFEV